MQKIAGLLIVLVSLSFGEGLGTAQIAALSQKGEKIAKVLCQADKLPKAKGTIEEIMDTIADSGACKKLSKAKLKAVAYYVSNGSMKANDNAMKVPEGAKCPVCGMFVSKYPKWAAMMEIDGHKHYFDGVKDLMKYYIFDADFPYDRNKITQIEVTDFYTLESIPARFAWFVYDSKLYGPMGRELIPFSTEEAAKNFMVDHGGKRIVRFKEITPKMVMALDGVEYNDAQ
jgi:nitrous oxide reductase accessory protein NosL